MVCIVINPKKEQKPKIRLQSLEKSKSTQLDKFTCHGCASRWAEWWAKEPKIHTFDSSIKLKKHLKKIHTDIDFPEAIYCPQNGCTYMAIADGNAERTNGVLREDLRQGLRYFFHKMYIKKLNIDI